MQDVKQASAATSSRHRASRRQATRVAELPLLQRSDNERSSSSTWSSSGFTVPLSSQTRPTIPSAFIKVLPPIPSRNGGSILTDSCGRERDVQASRGLGFDELQIGVPRQAAVAQTISHEYARRTATDRTCATLGRSWREGAKPRGAIPGAFFAVLDGKPMWTDRPPKTEMERYLESGGRVLGPVDKVFATEEEEEEPRGNVLGPDSNILRDLDEYVLSQELQPEDDVAHDVSRTHPTQQLVIPPPIIAASPRLGGSAGIMLSIEGRDRHHGASVLGGQRVGRPRVRTCSTGSPNSPRVSFHRDRCTVVGCHSGRRRVASTGWICGENHKEVVLTEQSAH